MNKQDKIERLNKVRLLSKKWKSFDSENEINNELASLMGYESYEDMQSADDFYTGSVIDAWCKGFEEALK